MARLNGPRAGAAPGAADSLVIFVHGYGANGEDLIGLAEPLKGVLPGAAFVSPDAPQRCAMSPFGFQWFPIPWMDGSTEQAMFEGFAASAAALDAFITEELERHSLPPGKAALVGFSQGTMMSLHVGPRRSAALGAIVGFSGRLLAPERLEAETRARPPVLLVHGRADQVVPFDSMAQAEKTLKGAGFTVETLARPGLGHGIDPEGLTAAARLLVGAFGA